MKTIPLNYPQDLWIQFENMCRYFKQKPGTAIRLYAKDAIGHPNLIAKAIKSAHARDASASPLIVKGVKWPEDLMVEVADEAARMHLNMSLYLRLVIEGVLAEFREKHPDLIQILELPPDSNVRSDASA